MAGVKGRSGGPRPGAGRKAKATIGPVAASSASNGTPAPPQVADAEELTIGDLGDDVDPLAFLEAVMRNPLAADQLRVRAAVTVAQYRHSKKGEGGKKDAKADAAKKASGGRFAPAAPPKPGR